MRALAGPWQVTRRTGRKGHVPGDLPKASDMETIILEIRAAEGGADARLLVYEQLAIYQRFAVREHL